LSNNKKYSLLLKEKNVSLLLMTICIEVQHKNSIIFMLLLKKKKDFPQLTLLPYKGIGLVEASSFVSLASGNPLRTRILLALVRVVSITPPKAGAP
jgi:hypothetical protein